MNDITTDLCKIAEKWGCKYTQIILRNIIQGIYIDKGNLDPVPFFQ